MIPVSQLVVLAALALAFAFVCVSFVLPTLMGAPWVPSSAETIRRMLLLSKVRPGEEVYDLGSGDGRIVVISAREFGARATGIEIDLFRAYYSRVLIWLLGLKRRARIIRANFYEVDLRTADVVTVYLLPRTNDKLRPKLERELKPECRVVSHVFKFGWKPLCVDEAAKIYVYSPRPAEGVGGASS